MYSIFISINAESLRLIVTENSYPEDKEARAWKLKDFVVWLCYCLEDEAKISAVS